MDQHFCGITVIKSMRLLIPLSRLSVVVTLERMPRTAHRWRLSLRGMMVGVATFAFLLWVGKVAVRHYLGKEVPRTYYVGDLFPNPADIESVVMPLKTSVPRDEWWSGERAVIPFLLSSSVIVRDTEAGHAHVQLWLRQQRDRRKSHQK